MVYLQDLEPGAGREADHIENLDPTKRDSLTALHPLLQRLICFKGVFCKVNPLCTSFPIFGKC